MEQYHKKHARAKPINLLSRGNRSITSLSSEYDRYHQKLVVINDNEGWAAELRRYLKERLADVTKDTDIVQWWQVCSLLVL
jgi:hypothetical protein